MKKTLVAVLAAGFGLTAFGSPLTPEQALQRLVSDSGVHRVRAAQRSSSLKCVASLPQIYVFSAGEGFVVCPADDSAPALLGYADTGEFTTEGNPALQWWLESYASQIEAGAAQAKVNRPVRQAVAPLIKSKWSQTAPFNNMCPTVNGKQCPVGCAATSIAQVMHYHQWPKQGTGTHSYTWTDNQTLTFDYANTTFDWANMTDTYSDKSTQKEIDAVATLMSACGIGQDMWYGTNSSGASPMVIGRFLTENMNYGMDMRWADRRYYSLLEWENLIYADLAKGLPVIYSGTGSGGGHQFVCDGYDTDGYFHINWGWAGMSDGYFLLSIMHPMQQGTGGSNAGYNIDQYAMLNVHPAKGGEKAVYNLAFENGFVPVEADSYGVGKALKFGGRVLNTSALPIPAESSVSIYFKNLDDASGLADFSFDEWIAQPIGVNRGWWNLGFASFPDYPEAGRYEISCALYTNQGKTVTPVQVMHGAPDHLIMTLAKDGTITFDDYTVNAGDPKASDIKLVKPYFLGENQPLVFNFTLANESADTDFRGKVYPAILQADGPKVLAQGTAVSAALMPGEAKEYPFSATLADAAYLTAGNYRLGITDVDCNLLGETIDIYIDKAPEVTEYTVPSIKLVQQKAGSNVITDKKNVQFKVTVACSKGYFYDRLRVRIFTDGSTYYPITSPYTGYFSAGPGEQDEQIVTLDLSSIDDGKYWALVTDAGQNILDPEHARFELQTPEPEPEPIVATEVILSQTSLTLEEGQSGSLVAIVKPTDAVDKTVVWESSNPAVATVTAGHITALAPGSAIITASCGAAKATCTLTVTAKPQEPDPVEDGLDELSTAKLSTVYDLQGRKVTNPRRGLYIQGGKILRK